VRLLWTKGCHLLQTLIIEPFALEEWRREWINLTNNWQSDRKVFVTTATGNALNISRSLYMKYLRGADLPEPAGTEYRLLWAVCKLLNSL
jgi:alpha-N-acetylglucosaminidase